MYLHAVMYMYDFNHLAFQDLNNFSGMFIVNAALESASVFRLTHTKKVGSV